MEAHKLGFYSAFTATVPVNEPQAPKLTIRAPRIVVDVLQKHGPLHIDRIAELSGYTVRHTRSVLNAGLGVRFVRAPGRAPIWGLR